MNTSTATSQFLLVSEAARELGVPTPALRKAARRPLGDVRASYELATWTRVAKNAGLIGAAA